ncbi:hypothetical protein DYL61_19095 [Pseudomonas nabeulensis]|uniref:Uncharacterized protein n=1 Tax=Pseudomonas nabeulensis TaxID=2293833 RepID=A0A4Z0AZA7_9PSED|nr:hypothetical protein [Pseudomonas nabeulensis]TFY91268.1 hypothetical protein DYL61_19095 [Pseudomonas nabeulensis]
MTVKVLEFKREGLRDAAKTLRKIADDLDAGEHPECTVGALTLTGPKGEVTVFGLPSQIHLTQQAPLKRKKLDAFSLHRASCCLQITNPTGLP